MFTVNGGLRPPVGVAELVVPLGRRLHEWSLEPEARRMIALWWNL
jgi:hypothetical protein